MYIKFFKEKNTLHSMAIVYLFTSPTCPHCITAKETVKKLNRKDVDVEEYSFATEEGKAKANEYGITRVPTWLIYGPGVKEIIGLVGGQTVETLKKYIDKAEGL